MIIDSHIHFYDPCRPEGVPWPPPGDVIYRTVLPPHFREVAVPAGVTGAIVIEAGPRLQDNLWVLDVIAGNPVILGFVAYLQPGTADFPTWLERLSDNPLVRGMRITIADQAEWREKELAHLEMLAARDLSLDVIVRTDGLHRVAELARLLPRLRVVIDHVAHVPIDGRPPDPAWAEGMLIAAAHPGVCCKVSRLTETAVDVPAPAAVEYYTPTLDFLWHAFGELRLLFGSNWPPCERRSPYSTVMSIAADYFKYKGERASRLFFAGNARSFYRLR